MVLLGVFVAAVAVFALNQPGAPSTANVAHNETVTQTVAPRSTGAAHHHAKTSASSARKHAGTSSTSSTSAVDPKSVPLVVLNNTTTTGLARDAAQRFEHGGWTVTKYDNYSNSILSTCAYYDPKVPGAQDAAEALHRQFPTIKRTKPKFAGLDFGPVVVILTPDYAP